MATFCSISVGVQRQYTGTAGKVDNAQVGTFFSYVTERGHAFLDRRHYLPEAWCADSERRRKAKVPEKITFETKPEQARSMLEQACACGAEMPWVTSDEVYGAAPALRNAIGRSGRSYVLAARTNEKVWAEWPPLRASSRQTGGQPRTKVRVAPEADQLVSVAQLVGSWPSAQWERLVVAEGEKRTASLRLGTDKSGRAPQGNALLMGLCWGAARRLSPQRLPIIFRTGPSRCLCGGWRK